MTRNEGRRGIAAGDALLVFSALALVFALAYPRIRRTALRDRIADAAHNVQVVVDASNRFQADQSRWPAPADAGTLPPELAPYLPAGFTWDRGEYQLDLDIWETAGETPEPEPPPPPPSGLEIPPPSDLAQAPSPGPEVLPPPEFIQAPPARVFGSLAGVTVHSTDPRILAGLMERFGDRRSFLHGTSWTLIFATASGR